MIAKARDFVFRNGTLWERALFSYLFDAEPLERVHRCLMPYKNLDGGWGNGLEHDIKAPDSHPLALEYLLTVSRDFDLPLGDLLTGTVVWLESVQNADGTLHNPASLTRYPIAPWWADWGGQTQPDSIVGNLTRLGLVTPTLADRTRQWAETVHSPELIRANDWLFMAYHAYDYFMNVDGFPDDYRQAVIENIVDCAQKMPEKQYHALFQFAPTPDLPVAQALPDGLIDRCLDHLESTQREDGGWTDEHNLLQWQSIVTMGVLMALQRYGRL